MKIDISNMQNELVELNEIIEEYELNYLNLKNCFNSVSFFWFSPLTQKYLDETNIGLRKQEFTIFKMKSLNELYNYIINQYSLLGKRIIYDMTLKNKIIILLDEIIKDNNELLEIYNSINFKSNIKISTALENERRMLLENKKNLDTYKQNIRNIYTKLEEIENKVREKIYHYEIDDIKI